MAEFFSYLNQNAGALQAIFALVVAVATVVYAWLTYKLVAETRRMRRAQSEPRIEVFFRPSDISVNFLEFVVKNIGLGAAYDIKFSVEPGRASDTLPKLVARLEAIQVLRTGMSFLAPSQEFFSFWDSLFGVAEPALNAPIRIRTSWKDAAGAEFEAIHVLNLQELLGMSRIGKQPMQVVAESLEALAKSIQGVVENRRLGINAYDSEDREREAKELREYFDAARNQANAASRPEDGNKG